MIQELRDRVAFKNGALYGKWLGPDLYVVYSYGVHWPLAAWYPSTRWSLNTSGNSRTTGKHLGMVRAALHGALVTEVSSGELLQLVSDLSSPASLAPDHTARKQNDLFAVSA